MIFCHIYKHMHKYWIQLSSHLFFTFILSSNWFEHACSCIFVRYLIYPLLIILSNVHFEFGIHSLIKHEMTNNLWWENCCRHRRRRWFLGKYHIINFSFLFHPSIHSYCIFGLFICLFLLFNLFFLFGWITAFGCNLTCVSAIFLLMQSFCSENVQLSSELILHFKLYHESSAKWLTTACEDVCATIQFFSFLIQSNALFLSHFTRWW